MQKVVFIYYNNNTIKYTNIMSNYIVFSYIISYGEQPEIYSIFSHKSALQDYLKSKSSTNKNKMTLLQNSIDYICSSEEGDYGIDLDRLVDGNRYLLSVNKDGLCNIMYLYVDNKDNTKDIIESKTDILDLCNYE